METNKHDLHLIFSITVERRHIWCTRAFYQYIPDIFLLQQPLGSTSAMGLSEWTEPDFRQDRSPWVQ